MNRTVAAALALAAMTLCGPVALAQSGAAQDRIDAALARARTVGIPASLLESKVAEGRAKGVTPDRIAAAIERRLGALERANRVLPESARATPGFLAVSADAIEAGIGDTVLRSLAEDAQADRRTVAVAALTELVRQGQGQDAALSRVRDALAKGPEALANLPAAAGTSSARGNARGQSSGSSSEGSNSGRGSERGRGADRGGGSERGGGPGRGNAGSGPPAAVPAPGNPPQSGRPDNPGNDGGRSGRGGGNEGRGGGNEGRGGGNEGRGNPGGPSNPGRGGR